MKRSRWVAVLAIAAAVPVVAWAADAKISALVAKTSPAAGDLAMIVDVSDTTMSSAGSDKKVTLANLATYFSGAVTGLAEGQVTNLTTDLTAKAPLASPALSGVPTAPTATVGTNTTQIATTAFVIANAGGGGGSGTVTSVGLTVPSGLSVTGSPVTTTGTLGITTALSGVLKGTGSGFAAATAGTDYLTPSGSGAALTGITESQVTNLSTDLTAITGRLSNLETVTDVSVTGAATLSGSALGKYHVCSGTSADYTVVLPTAVGNAGKTIAFRMTTGLTKFVTLDGNASEAIDGALTRVMWSRETAVLESDGSNWSKIGGHSRPLAAKLGRVTAQTMTWGSDNTISFDNALFDNSGAMDDTAGHQVLAKRAGTYSCKLAGFAGNSDLVDGNRILGAIRNNGTQLTLSELSVGTGGSNVALVTDTGLVSLAAGDAITASVIYVGATGTASVMAPILEVREFDPW